MEKPDIYRYTSFRSFLKDYFAFRKSEQSSLSHRFLSQKVGSSSVGWFGDVLAGRRKLTGPSMLKLVDWLGLGESEEDYFELLVSFDQVSSHTEKDRYYRRILARANLPTEVLSKERFEYFDSWLHTVVREIILTQGFDGNYKTLLAKIRPKITMAEIKNSVELLERLNLIARQAAGHYKAVHNHLAKDTETGSLSFRNYIHSSNELAKEALEMVPPELRDFSMLVLSIPPERMTEVKREMKTLRNRLKSLSDEKSPKAEVHQCLFQIFPVTKS